MLCASPHVTATVNGKKRIDWYDDDIDFTVPGTYKIKGESIRQIRVPLHGTEQTLVPLNGRVNITSSRQTTATATIQYQFVGLIRFRGLQRHRKQKSSILQCIPI